jgi:hypothetical protein
MSAVATITLADAQATPVNHSFVPLGTDKNGVWWFEDQTASSPVGNSRISLSLVRPASPSVGTSSNGRVARVKLGVHMPTLTTLGTSDAGLTPPPTVQYINRVNVEFILSEESSLQNRKDAKKYTVGLLGDAAVVDMVHNLINLY